MRGKSLLPIRCLCITFLLNNSQEADKKMEKPDFCEFNAYF